ncbi:Conserved_hypothetical protein [Hexamita inflata]|uniref:Uncharacterized protein n=1 Tax=Hexamita inflata TaxID=28002 RepID=A0AA86TU27_9EUKA|nr:Conserved hypothetical protein [Hexamita inflata]
MESIKIIQNASPHQAYLKLFLHLQTKIIAVESFQDYICKDEEFFKQMLTDLENSDISRFAAQTLLFIQNWDLPTILQQTLCKVLYDDCPEAFAILLQNKCDQKLIKSMASQLVRRDFNESILMFCSQIDPDNLILKNHAKNILARKQSQTLFAQQMLKLSLSNQDLVYKQILTVFEKYVNKSINFDAQELNILSQCLDFQPQSVFIDYILDQNDQILLKQLLLIQPSSIQYIKMKFQMNQKYKQLNNFTDQLILTETNQQFSFKPIIDKYSEVYLVQYVDVNQMLLQLKPEFKQMINLVPYNRRALDVLTELNTMPNFATLRNILGCIPTAFTQLKSNNALEKLLRTVEEQQIQIQEVIESEIDPTVIYLSLALLNPLTCDLAKDKLQLHPHFVEYFALYNEFLGTAHIDDLNSSDYLTPVITKEYQPGPEIDLRRIIEFKTDSEFFMSPEYQQINHILSSSSQISQFRSAILDLFELEFTDFKIGFFDTACKGAQTVLLQFLLKTIDPKNAFQSSFLVRFFRSRQILNQMFTDKQYIRKLVILNLLGEIELFQQFETHQYYILDANQRKFAQTTFQSDEKEAQKVEFDFYALKTEVEDIAKVMPILVQTDPDAVCQIILGGNQINGNVDNTTLNNEFLNNALALKAKSLENLLENQSLFYSLTLALQQAPSSERSVSLANQLLEHLQTTFIAKTTLSVQFLKDLVLFDALLVTASAAPLKIKTGILTFLPVFQNADLSTPLQQRCAEFFIKVIGRYIRLLQNEKLVSQNLMQVVGCFANKLVETDYPLTVEHFEQLLGNTLRFEYPEALDMKNVLLIYSVSQSSLKQENIKFLVKLLVVYFKQKTVTFEQTQFVVNQLQAYNKWIPALAHEFCDLLLQLNGRVSNAFAQNLQLSKQFILLLKLCFQELYFAVKNNQSTNSAQQYQNAYLLLMQYDLQFILDNKMIAGRQNNQTKFTAMLSMSLQIHYQEDVLYQFLKMSKSAAAFLVELLEDSELCNVIINQLGSTKSMYIMQTLIKNYFSDNQMLFHAVLTKLLEKPNCEPVYLDLIALIAQKLTDYEGDYQFNCQNVVNTQKFLIDNYSNMNCQQQTASLIFISFTLTKYSLFIIDFAIKVSQNLDYQQSHIDKIQLAFLCHVRNLMGDDRRKSDVLPAGLLKYVKELR